MVYSNKHELIDVLSWIVNLFWKSEEVKNREERKYFADILKNKLFVQHFYITIFAMLAVIIVNISSYHVLY